MVRGAPRLKFDLVIRSWVGGRDVDSEASSSSMLRTPRDLCYIWPSLFARAATSTPDDRREYGEWNTLRSLNLLASLKGSLKRSMLRVASTNGEEQHSTSF